MHVHAFMRWTGGTRDSEWRQEADWFAQTLFLSLPVLHTQTQTYTHTHTRSWGREPTIHDQPLESLPKRNRRTGWRWTEEAEWCLSQLGMGGPEQVGGGSADMPEPTRSETACLCLCPVSWHVSEPMNNEHMWHVPACVSVTRCTREGSCLPGQGPTHGSGASGRSSHGLPPVTASVVSALRKAAAYFQLDLYTQGPLVCTK